jgi:hypothetical protein
METKESDLVSFAESVMLKKVLCSHNGGWVIALPFISSPKE